MSVILLTGGAGFIGRNLVLNLLAAGETVIAVDRRLSADDAHAPWGDRFIEEVVDIGDQPAMRELLGRRRPEVIVALADDFGGPLAELVPASVAAQAALLAAAQAADVRRVCMTSSLAVYMGIEGPFREDMPLPLRSSLHVAAVKKAVEVLAHWYDDVTPMNVVAMRLANIYGPRYHSMMNTVSRYLFEALGRPIPADKPKLDLEVYRALADFCYVDDCCEGIRLVATAERLEHTVYNIGGGAAVSDGDLRRAVARAVGRHDVAEPQAVNRNHLDIQRIGDELGYRPAHDLDSGMLAYRRWLDENRN